MSCLVPFGSCAKAIRTQARRSAIGSAGARANSPNRAMSEALVPPGPFASVTLTDRRNEGERLAAGGGVASMVYGMIGTFVPAQKLRPVFAKISGMLGKLVPVAQRIDFYKSGATHKTFDRRMWRTRGVTHYRSPAERGTEE